MAGLRLTILLHPVAEGSLMPATSPCVRKGRAVGSRPQACLATMQVSEGLAVGGQVGGGLCRAPIAYCGRRGDRGPSFCPLTSPRWRWLPP